MHRWYSIVSGIHMYISLSSERKIENIKDRNDAFSANDSNVISMENVEKSETFEMGGNREIVWVFAGLMLLITTIISYHIQPAKAYVSLCFDWKHTFADFLIWQVKIYFNRRKKRNDHSFSMHHNNNSLYISWNLSFYASILKSVILIIALFILVLIRNEKGLICDSICYSFNHTRIYVWSIFFVILCSLMYFASIGTCKYVHNILNLCMNSTSAFICFNYSKVKIITKHIIFHGLLNPIHLYHLTSAAWA